MTLVLAVKGVDGVVMAADGASTVADDSGVPYASQTAMKVHCCAGKFIWGASGDVGVIQRIQHKLDQVQANDMAMADPQELRARVVAKIVPVLKECRADYIGPADPSQRPRYPGAEVLFATALPSGPFIVSINPDGKNDLIEGPHLAIGSGAAAAMAIMHKHRHQMHNCELNQIIAYRAVADAIDVTPVFLAPPIRIGMVSRPAAGGGPPQARILSPEEISAVEGSVELWTEFEREALLKTLSGLGAVDAGADGIEPPPTVSQG